MTLHVERRSHLFMPRLREGGSEISSCLLALLGIWNGLLLGLLDDLSQGKLTVVAAFSTPPCIPIDPYLLSQIVLNRPVLVFYLRSSDGLDNCWSAIVI